jgi:alpha-glucosidase
MAEPHNPELRSIDDCYMLGDALLVAPVLSPHTVKRSVYLPEGRWYDYWTGEVLEGGQTVTVPAPLERLPLFVRAGAVLPHWPEMAYTSEKPVETLIYRVYPGEFETVIYEDRGEGLDYENGDYRWIYITSGWEESRFLINRRIAGQYTPSYKDMKLEIYGFDEEPSRVRVDRQGAPLWFYDDGLLELTVDSFQRIEIMRKSLPTDATIVRRPW